MNQPVTSIRLEYDLDADIVHVGISDGERWVCFASGSVLEVWGLARKRLGELADEIAYKAVLFGVADE